MKVTLEGKCEMGKKKKKATALLSTVRNQSSLNTEKKNQEAVIQMLYIET